MASKRMFSKSVIATEKFYDLPMSTKGLYFLLGMEADDYGFVSPNRVLRTYGGTDDEIKILIAKGFLIAFESGVVIITDWNKNNYLNKTRTKPTEYLEELNMLDIENDRYCLTDVKHMLDEPQNFVKPSENLCLTNAKPMLNQYSIDEISIEEDRVVVVEDSNKVKQEEKNNNDNNEKIGPAKYYEKYIGGLISGTMAIHFRDFKECGVEDDLICRAIDISIEAGVRNWNYARAIVDDCINKGILTLEQYNLHEANRRAKKNMTASNESTNVFSKMREKLKSGEISEQDIYKSWEK